jgi:hypothetical protein
VTKKGIAARPQRSDVGPLKSPIHVQPALRLHVDELVLHGFQSANRFTIGKAVERELARLFATNGVPPSLARLGQIAYLDGRSFEMKPSRQPTALGAQVASAVYQALTR